MGRWPLPEGEALRFRFFEIEHPVDAELIGQHAKPGAPERVLERHRHLSLIANCGEELFEFLLTLTVHANRKIAALLKWHAGHGIGSHQHSGSVRQPCVHDSIFRLWRMITGHLGERHHV